MIPKKKIGFWLKISPWNTRGKCFLYQLININIDLICSSIYMTSLWRYKIRKIMTTSCVNNLCGYFVVKLRGVEAENLFYINNFLWMTTGIILMKISIVTIKIKQSGSCMMLVGKLLFRICLSCYAWSWMWYLSVFTVLWKTIRKYQLLPRPYLESS